MFFCFLFFYHSECKNCCFYIIIQKIALQAQSETCFQIWFFSQFGRKKWWCSEHALDSLFARPGSSPIWGGKKGDFRDWTTFVLETSCARPSEKVFLHSNKAKYMSDPALYDDLGEGLQNWVGCCFMLDLYHLTLRNWFKVDFMYPLRFLFS